MSTSRIEIPLTLQPPHFDDDATIATARQVVPIKGGRKIEGRRKVLGLLPLLLASTLCGALGAIGVHYLSDDETRYVRYAAAAAAKCFHKAKTEPPPVASRRNERKEHRDSAPVQPENSSVTPTRTAQKARRQRSQNEKTQIGNQHETPQ